MTVLRWQLGGQYNQALVEGGRAAWPPPRAGPPRGGRRARAVRAAAKQAEGEVRTSKRQAPSSAASPDAGGQTAAEAASPAVDAARRESLTLLEWPGLCRQVACFARTPMGAEVAMAAALPIGRSQRESEVLLRQTAEAQRAQLEFTGAYDIRRAVETATAGRVLHPLVLGAVATTLGAAAGLLRTLGSAARRGDDLPALRELAEGLGDALPELRAAIEQCVQPGEGRILDGASPALAAVRQERRANRDALQAEVEGWARTAAARGLSERAAVVVRRDRLCIPVRAGRQGELPRGSVCLATSATGNTLYMEPQPAVALNNAEMALAGREAEEEAAVLVALSGGVAAQAPRLRALLASLTALDVAAARARHAAWLGAAAPRFLSAEEAAQRGPVRLPRAWHPLLLQPSLPPLPAPPLPAEALQQAEAEVASGPLAALSLVPELAAAATPEPVSALGKAGQAAAGGGGAAAPERPPPPQPVDLCVPAGVRVVAVTGPNTGGKTASLKALGLSCLMAKAGLFPAQAPADGGAPPPAPALLWFDAVLADLGDGQSLQQSLSTFSGHVRRIRNVLAAATPQSLVLLDEVGSGTDPAEGAALAGALLERLHGGAALTYATTHHAELKELASCSPGFVNASVEFDVASLRPTYRLLWGEAGESNALAVAQGLGFAPPVVAAAREVAAQLRQGGQEPAQRSVQLQASLAEQLGEAGRQARAAADARSAAEAAAAEARRELEAAQAAAAAAQRASGEAKAAGAAAQRRVQRLLADVKAGRLDVRGAEEALRAMEREAAPPGGAAARLLGLRAAAEGGAGEAEGGGSPEPSGAAGAWAPAEGDAVRVLKMGGAPGRVVSAGRAGGKVGVRVGSLTVELRLADLAPAGTNGGSGGTARRRAAAAKGGAASGLQSLGQLRAGRGGGGADAAPPAERPAVAIQTSRNTVDVRGQRAEEAAAEVQEAVASAPPGLALFVVHGVGTGRVRAAVQALLRRSPRVARTEEAEGSNGGCTVVYVK